MSSSKKKKSEGNGCPVEDISTRLKKMGEDDSDSEASAIGENIDIEFEGRTPSDHDFHGIKRLLQQLFLKSHIDLSEMANCILSENKIGSVVKQCDDVMSDDEDDCDPNEVFGVSTIVNLSKNKLEFSKQLLSDLKTKVNECPTDSKEKLLSILTSEELKLGLLLNERFINIPLQISIPLLQSLSKELEALRLLQKNWNLDYLLIICKTYKSALKKKKMNSVGRLIYSNPEEELLEDICNLSFEWSVKGQSDSGLTGNWGDDDTGLDPHRKCFVLPVTLLKEFISKIQSSLA